MFQCSSIIPSLSSFDIYLREYGWEIEKDSRLFTQINQSELLKEFLEVILSPLQQQGTVTSISLVQPEPSQTTKKTKVFVSYSHQNRKFLADDSLLGYLRGLEQENFEFWSDERIITSESWDDEIRNQINSSDIALVLVSQAYLNSRYCREAEITTFLEERKKRGLRIFPVILSACDWKSQSWLSSTQFQPAGGKNIESDFRDRGKRSELFLKIYQDLRSVSEKIKKI